MCELDEEDEDEEKWEPNISYIELSLWYLDFTVPPFCPP